MRRDLFVYLSGPMAAKDGFTFEENMAVGVRAFVELVTLGVPTFCPHLAAMFPSAYTIPFDVMLEMEYAIIDRCTHVVMLPRWINSVGAAREHDYALETGKQVVAYEDFVRFIREAHV